MINIDDVKNIVSSVGGYNDEDIERYLSIIENASASVEKMLKNDAYSRNSRIVYLAGVKACNDISLAIGTGAGGGITSFKVGDISITEGANKNSSFSQLYKSAIENCRDMLYDNGSGFAFIDV